MPSLPRQIDNEQNRAGKFMLKLIFTCTDDDESEGQRCCHTLPRFIVWKALIEWKTICIFAMAWNSMSSKSDKNAFNGEQFTTLSRHILSATRPKTFLRTLERTLLPCTCELQSFKFQSFKWIATFRKQQAKKIICRYCCSFAPIKCK